MIVHNFDPVLIDLGFFQIRWYSIAYIGGIILGWVYAIKIIKKIQSNQYNFQSVTTENFDDLVSYLIIGIIVGGRLGYVFFYDFQFFIFNPVEIIKIWKGGMSFHGGLIGITLSIFFFSLKNKISFFVISDLVACAAPIGIFFGRIANFINGELVGRVTEKKIGVIFRHIDNLPRHASQIYEAILEGLLLFLILLFLKDKKKFLYQSGLLSSLFLILYSFFRFICEYYREPDAHIGLQYLNLSLGQIYSIFFFIIGSVIFFKKNK